MQTSRWCKGGWYFKTPEGNKIGDAMPVMHGRCDFDKRSLVCDCDCHKKEESNV